MKTRKTNPVAPMRLAFDNVYSSSPLTPVSTMSGPVIISSVDSSEKKSIWGQPTWFLFHSLAEKVREEAFASIRMELLNIIVKICNFLPCQYCADHATHYLNGINFNTIQTKSDLKIMLWQFHNSVNERKKYTIMPLEDLDVKYSKSNIQAIIQNFMYYYDLRNSGMPLTTNKLQRDLATDAIKKWLNANIQHFL